MNTALGKFAAVIARRALIGVLAVSLAGCGSGGLFAKKCQQNTQRYTRLPETQWRLVETDDPTVKGLDKYNFLIYNFSRNFSGNFQRVAFNDLYEQPVANFNWNISEDGALLMKFTATTGGGQGSPSVPRNTGTVTYYFDIGRTLELEDAQTGYYYFLVPYTGVVDPDDDCVFR